MIEQLTDWDDLRWILAIARSKSLTGAAQSLGVSHPTVFRRINRIEKSLGVRLFERSHDGYTPTPAGDEAAALAEQLEQSIEGIARRMAGQDLRPSGTVRVTTTDTLLFGLLTPLFGAFRRAHPEITLEVVAANAIFNLTKRDADVAIRPSRDPPETLVGRKITDFAVAIYRPRSAVMPDALADCDWVAPDDSLSYLRPVRWLEEHGLVARVVYRANTLVGLLDAVRSGIGLALLPCYLGDPEQSLVRVGESIGELRSELWLLTHPELRRVARIRAFMEFMTQALQPLQPLFEGRQPVPR